MVDVSHNNVDISNIDISNVDISNVITNVSDSSNSVVDISNGFLFSDSERKFDFFNDPLVKNITTNWLFYLTIVIAVYFICKEDGNHNFFIGIFSFIVVSATGYFIHVVSHYTKYTKIYDRLDNYFTRNKYSSYFLRKMCILVDFHDDIHHDSSINKKPINILYEFLLNFVTQSGTTLAIMFYFRNISYWVVALWGLLYATIHIINYEFVKPRAHMLHHVDKHTNYGLDIWDVIFNTKYKKDNHDVENINHGSINVALLALGMIYCIRKFNK